MIIHSDGIVHQAGIPDYTNKTQKCLNCDFIIQDYSGCSKEFLEEFEVVYWKGFVTIFGNEKDMQQLEGICSIIRCDEDKYKI